MSTMDMTTFTQEPSQIGVVVASDMMMGEFERTVVENNIVRASDGLWNLTAFGKLFDKKFKHWYQTKHAKEFVEVVQASELGRDVLFVGSYHTPTWGHYKIASDMLYQSNVAYAMWVTTLATRYAARDPTLATEVDRRVGVSNKRSHDEVYEAAPLSVLDSTATQLVALAPEDKKIETYERLAKCTRELVEARQLLALREKDRLNSELALYNARASDMKTASRVVEVMERSEERRMREAEENTKAAVANATAGSYKIKEIEAHKATWATRLEVADREFEVGAQQDRLAKTYHELHRMRKELLTTPAAEPNHHPSSWTPPTRKA